MICTPRHTHTHTHKHYQHAGMKEREIGGARSTHCNSATHAIF